MNPDLLMHLALRPLPPPLPLCPHLDNQSHKLLVPLKGLRLVLRVLKLHINIATSGGFAERSKNSNGALPRHMLLRKH